MPAEFELATATELSVIDSRDVVALLRVSVLRLDPADIDIDPQTAAAVWGIVIETGYPDAVASLIALADGSVSLYVSDGSGCVGCGANREVRTAGADLLAAAEHGIQLTTSTDDTSYPPSGDVRFCFLSLDGLRSLQVKLEDLNSVDAHLSALYFAGQRVISAIERTGAGQSIDQEIRLAQSELAVVSQRGTPKLTVGTAIGGVQPCLSVGSAVHRLRR
jgi:hypothetical protein